MYRLRICSQILLWEPESAECIEKTSRQTKWKQGARGSRLRELEKQVSASAHFKSSSLIREEPEKSETKRVALQRSYHFVSQLVSWSGNSRRSQAGSLLPFDERFPTFSVSTD